MTPEQMAVVYGKHGHVKGGLNLHDISSGEKTRVKKPDYIAHIQKRKNQANRRIIIARGQNVHGRNVAQIVHSEQVS